MQQHIKNYLEFFDIFEWEYIPCTFCWKHPTCDFHHIKYKSQWGKDNVENIASLCRSCHDRSHFKKEPYISAEDLTLVHSLKMKLYLKNIKNNN